MSMPISKIAKLIGLPVCGALLLTGCLSDEDFSGQPSLGFRAAPVTAIKVSQREVTIAGPKGYCVDKASSRDRAAGSFVMLGSCATLFGADQPAPADPAVLTALVSPPSTPPQRPSPAQLEQYFRSEAGKAALSHDGQAGTVTLLKIVPLGDALYMNVRDKSPGRPSDLSDRSWRAVFPLADRLIALSVTEHSDRPISDTDMRTTLGKFVEAVMRANTSARPKLRPGDET